ncbi:MAG: hypothetical protein US20_C0023G0011 [Candidatus Pacebacteria bacterium GW2011_GWF1_36_5]|nr:MAG: hypothetical protein US20_C0023G0011 [Candidatus Pacebacteria bacterium GW2011_GWF1_36_5]
MELVGNPSNEHLGEIEKWRGRNKKHQTTKVVQINDTHIPYHDPKTLKAIFDFLDYFKPDKLIIAGDFLDFYELSKFDKNPARKFSLQDELDIAYKILKGFKELVPEIHFISGNHEQRLRRFLWKNPELSSLKVLEIAKLLNLDLLDIHYHEHNFIYNDFIFTHGGIVRKHSGYSAKAELDKHGTSGSSGHTHRLGSAYKTDHRGTITWFENGCTCLLEPEYIQGIPDWQQAISVFYFDDNRFSPLQIPIIKNQFIFDGRRFGK